MEWFTLVKIGLLIFGLTSWILFKGERSIKKDNLDDYLSLREPIRDLTDEELALLQPFLTSKWAVYPYKFQSSLVDNKVSQLQGICSRHSLNYNTEEINYYYEIGDIEIFFPYNMNKHIDQFNTIDVVFTKQYAIVVNINGNDLKTAQENYDPNEEYEFEDFGDLKDNTCIDKFYEKRNDNRDAFDIESLTLYDDDERDYTQIDQEDDLKSIDGDKVNSDVSINKNLYQREETAFEATIRSNLSNCLSISICLLLATFLLTLSWHSRDDNISFLILMFLGGVAFLAWRKPKFESTPQQVKVIEATIHDKYSNIVEVGENTVLKYPKYWSNFIPKSSDSATEMVISEDGKKLLRYGHTLSIHDEVEQFGPPKSVGQNKILLGVGIILSFTLLYYTDPINNGYFAYRYYSQQSKNLQINDLTTLHNSDIKHGDIVNISIKNTSCDVNDLTEDFQCHNFFINSQPIVVKERDVMSIETSLKHIFSPDFIQYKHDEEFKHFEKLQQVAVARANYELGYEAFTKNPFSKIKSLGQMVIDIDNSCNILPVEQCDQVKFRITDLFYTGDIFRRVGWDKLLERSKKNPDLDIIAESMEILELSSTLDSFNPALQKEIKTIVSQYQSGIEITLTNQSYIDMRPLIKIDIESPYNSMKLYEYKTVNYYFDILNSTISPNVNIVGVVSDIRYGKDQNSKTISALKVNANHRYNLDENQTISFFSLININVIVFIVMILTAVINGVKLVKNTKVNQRRIDEIKKYYENRLGTIVNLE